ncbi:HIRAN domain-containing protein [Staphylococcus aureus]|uniref:HIRAN domain-containing protein n=1 Tax=Staphylococcus aureus TaxID=1280 RepID=UPI0013A69CB0|nr:HIRAN domain-containing protein [Staphylococcus aureus]MDD9404407.1 HIRAN domain-containing protein [Staphylococcus aureus]MDD9409790.1 HIRAN domain-containing protein [Staphylococcus aureus]MDD9417812.1 HIRAN domain-containing protein [Staphylococcus aureus]MDD9420517.1 HIRAN domain-containing protein [Staphylococcus aureus]MDD9423280.1 HIRAN domain-containing protein [Staphylococcus aureus]
MKPRKQDEKILSDQYSYFEPIISDSCDIKFDENKRRMGSIFISHEEICFIRKEEDYIFKISLSEVIDYNTVVTIWKNQAFLTLNDNRKLTVYFVTNSPLTGFISILKTYMQLSKNKETIISNDCLPINDDEQTKVEIFDVVGLNYEGRRKELKKLIKKMKNNDDFFFLYSDLKGNELKEELLYEDKVYEISDYEVIPGVFLQKEPDNPYDENAIKVMISNEYSEFHVGYVPREYASRLVNNMDNIVSCNAYINGGKYKTLDYLEEKIVTKESDYGLRVHLEYKV